jgi:acyl-CoA thioesterase-2
VTSKSSDAQLWSFLFPPVNDGGGFRAVAAQDTNDSGHPFGGFLLALATWAASVHAPGRFPHALHGFFLRPIRAGEVLDGQVSSLRDGRRFSQRQVSLSQDGQPVFTAMVSLQISGDPSTSPQAAGSQATIDARAPQACVTTPLPFQTGAVSRFLDIRTASAVPLRLWIRPRSPLPGGDAAHYALLAAMTDVGPARIPMPDLTGGDAANRQISGVTLTHSIWFHRQPRLGGWVLLSLDGVPSAGGRSLALGKALSRDGARCATYVQEVLGARTGC